MNSTAVNYNEPNRGSDLYTISNSSRTNSTTSSNSDLLREIDSKIIKLAGTEFSIRKPDLLACSKTILGSSISGFIVAIVLDPPHFISCLTGTVLGAGVGVAIEAISCIFGATYSRNPKENRSALLLNCPIEKV